MAMVARRPALWVAASTHALGVCIDLHAQAQRRIKIEHCSAASAGTNHICNAASASTFACMHARTFAQVRT
jgi:hypothetical protein